MVDGIGYKGGAEMSDKLRMDEKEKLRWALEITKKYNSVKNDMDAYLYEVCEYALGFSEKPDPEDFGLDRE